MRNYIKLNAESIVIETLQTSEDVSKEWKEVTFKELESGLLGKKWNGKTFEEVPSEEVEAPETTEVTNEDLLEVLLAIGEKVGA